MAATLSLRVVNLAALVGVAGFVMGKTTGRWEPVRGHGKGAGGKGAEEQGRGHFGLRIADVTK